MKQEVLIIGGIIIFILIIGLTIQPVEHTHYAEAFYQDYSTPISIVFPAEDVYVNITGFAFGEVEGFGMQDNEIMVNQEGLYSVLGTMSFSGGNGGEYEIELFKNGVAVDKCSFFRSTSSVAIGDASLSCLIYLYKDDKLIMKIKDLSAPAQNANIYVLNFKIIQITIE